jgi:hypothetical protein
MPNTMTLISAVTVGSGGASSIDFTSIPGTYTDLLLKVSGRATINETGFSLQFNGNTSTSNYSYRTLKGSGAAASSSSETSLGYIGGRIDPSTYTANIFNNYELYVPNYAGSAQKCVSVDSVNENNSNAADSMIVAGLWNQTSAITSIKLYVVAGSLAQYSTAYLYGINKS